jgi:signal transduction histidine kinase
LEALANRVMRAYGLQIVLDPERMPERLAPQIELALFRTAQDVLEHTARHAQASRVVMRPRSVDQCAAYAT